MYRHFLAIYLYREIHKEWMTWGNTVFHLHLKFQANHPKVDTYHTWACRRACQHCRVLSDRGSWAEWCPTVVRLLAKKGATCWPTRGALLPGDSSAGLLALAGWDLAAGLNTWGREWGIVVSVVQWVFWATKQNSLLVDWYIQTTWERNSACLRLADWIKKKWWITELYNFFKGRQDNKGSVGIERL